MNSHLSAIPILFSQVSAELDALAGSYLTVLNLSEQAVARAPLVNLGQQALGLQMAHAEFLTASIAQQSLLIQAREMLEYTSRMYCAQEQENVQAISAAGNI